MANERRVWVMLATAMLPLLGGCDGESDAMHASPIATVAFGTNRPDQALEAPCVVKPKAQVRVKSEISGKVEQVAASPGDRVGQGQLLARIDTRELSNALERNQLAQRQTIARIELAELQLERAKRNREIMARLNEKGRSDDSRLAQSNKQAFGIEEMDVKEKRSDLQQFDLSLEDLRLQERELRRSLGLAEIRSPLAGVVLNRSVEEGMLVGSGISQFGGGDVLFEVADVTNLKAECFARESESWQLEVGLPARISPDGRRGEAVVLTLTHVAPAIELVSGVPRLKFEADFTAVSSHWRPGVSATISIQRAADDSADSLPGSAVIEANGRQFVFVQRGQTYERTEVRAERAADAWRVISGLKRGELVAKDPRDIDAMGGANG